MALSQQPSLNRAWALLAQGKRAEAIQLLYSVVKATPADADARLLLGSALMEAGQGSESIVQLTQAVRLRPDSAQAQNALGEALNNFGDANAARVRFEKAVSLDPGFATAQVNLGLVLLKSGDDSGAGPHLDRAISLLGHTPDAAYPRYLRARIEIQHGQAEAAAADLVEAVSMEPHFAEALSDLGEARRILGDPAGALQAFEQAVRFAPNDPVAETRFGSELLQQGRAQEAIPHLESAARIDPTNQSALYNLERALETEGRTADAQAVTRELAALLREKDRSAQHSFEAIQLNDQGVALQKSGKLREAIEKYRAALALDPAHNGIRVNYAAALLHAGEWNEGVAQLHEVLRRDPDNRAIQAALKEALAHPVSEAR